MLQPPRAQSGEGNLAMATPLGEDKDEDEDEDEEAYQYVYTINRVRDRIFYNTEPPNPAEETTWEICGVYNSLIYASNRVAELAAAEDDRFMRRFKHTNNSIWWIFDATEDIFYVEEQKKDNRLTWRIVPPQGGMRERIFVLFKGMSTKGGEKQSTAAQLGWNYWRKVQNLDCGKIVRIRDNSCPGTTHPNYETPCTGI